MPIFSQEFHTLNYVIKESEKILLFAHSRPDGDTTGAVLALKEYIAGLGKEADAACLDPLPEYLAPLAFFEKFVHPDKLDLQKYNLVIACDSVQRGFEKYLDQFSENQVTAIIDHHPDITIQADINILDSKISSVCELIYEFFVFNKIEISKKIAIYLMLGILSDTGMLQHANTTSRLMKIVSELMKKGVIISKIVETTLANKKISTLRLWGKAFEKAKINQKNGMIATVLTAEDVKDCHASNDDIAQVASILNTVPGTKFSLILSERGDGVVKGSLRSEEYKGVDVSEVAARFGGGGHKLASGFEMKGKIVETENGWEIV